MPTRCANPEIYQALCEIRDNEDQESNMWTVYNRACKSLKAHPTAIHRIDDAIEVPQIGPKIVAALKKKLLGSAEKPNPSTKKSAARPKKGPSDLTSSSSSDTLRDQSVDIDSDTFPFCYLSYDNDGREIRVRQQSGAHVEIAVPGFYIEYPRSCQHPIISQLASTTPQPNRMIGYLPLDIADLFPKSTLSSDWITRTQQAAVLAGSSTLKQNATDILAAENAQVQKKQKARSSGLDPSCQTSTAGNWTISSSASSGGRNASLGEQIQRSQTMPQIPSSSRTQQQPTPSSSQAHIRRSDSAPVAAGKVRNRPRLSHALPTLPVDMDIDIEDPYASTERAELPQFQTLIFPSSEYEVVLILDTREIKSGRDRSGIYDGLRRLGVAVEQRALAIGDVCWIARRKNPKGSEYDEITLDCILERKRLDDLVGSIKDGRFHEQKFRLHNTAITNVYYLVEEYKLNAGVSEEQDKRNFEGAIDTASSQTAVIERFKLKETKSISHTIEFYARLHQKVASSCKNQNFHVIPSEVVKRYNYLKLQKELRRNNPDVSHLLSWKTFSFLNSKSGFITVRETWARMLLCISGVSPEKAGVLVQHFPTLQSMYKACKDAERKEKEDNEDSEVERRRGGKGRAKKNKFIAEEFLKDYGGNTNRKIGAAMSKKIFRLIMSLQYLDD